MKLRILFARQSNVMMRLWLIGLTLLSSIKADLTIDGKVLHEVLRELGKVVNLNSEGKYWLEKSPDSVFSCLKRVVVGLMDVADKTFHRKD